MKRLLLVLAIAFVAGVNVLGQAEGPPRIVTSATSEVSVPAYKARFTIGVVARADRAKDAGVKVATILNAVRDALVKVGVERSSLASAGYSVGLEQNDGARQPKTYAASSSLSVELTNLEQLGTVIDAGLSAGATEVSEIRFLPRDADAARAHCWGAH